MQDLLDLIGEAKAVAIIGLLGGLALGLAARRGRFCTLGAIEDTIYSSDNRRLRMWGIAIAVAMLGTHLAALLGAFDLSAAPYLIRGWNPVATILGGLLFGYGMALSGNCGYGALARFGGGDLRAFVIVVVMGLSAYVVMSGPLAHLRVWIFPVSTDPDGTQGFGNLLGPSAPLLGLFLGAVILCLSLASKEMRRAPEHMFWGTVVGLAILSGWLGTHWVSQVGFSDQSLDTHTFVAPIGETLLYAMTASGTPLSFGVGSVVGVLLGACLGSYSKGHFRWEACEDPRELRRQIVGAALMGPGAILAFGCSVGQGISAFSVLAYSAPVAFLSIFIGAAIGLRQLIVGFAPAE